SASTARLRAWRTSSPLLLLDLPSLFIASGTLGESLSGGSLSGANNLVDKPGIGRSNPGENIDPVPGCPPGAIRLAPNRSWRKRPCPPAKLVCSILTIERRTDSFDQAVQKWFGEWGVHMRLLARLGGVIVLALMSS